jgi:hypothetical protein
MPPVTMTCMTTKKQFEVDDPPVQVLRNGRYAYRVQCPWEGKNGKVLHAFKFCSGEAYRRYCEQQKAPEPETMEREQGEAPESP